MRYFSKMKGATTSPPRVSISEMLWSWVGSFIGIAAVALLVNNLAPRRRYPEFWF